MGKAFALFLFFLSGHSYGFEFECKSGLAAVVTDLPHFDQFTLKGELLSNMEMHNVSLKFNNYPLREAFFGVLQPNDNGNISYHFFDGQDYRYELRFPKLQSEKTFKSEISISLEGHISTESLECNVNPAAN